MDKIELKTERLRLVPLDICNMQLLLEDTAKLEENLNLTYKGPKIVGEMRKAVEELCLAMKQNPKDYAYNTLWQFILESEAAIIGSACFKGVPDDEGKVEIGYGINKAYQNKGYTKEAVKEMCRWALMQDKVLKVIAETDKDNFASHKILEYCGMKKYKETEGSFWWEVGLSN